MGIIRVLPPETSRLIAAGEVIDRPAAVLREFLDNAIDSGAREISVEIEGGGIDLIRITDDGSGMDPEDLGLSILPHATSKISVADDLLKAKTLGFRGEALASVAVAAQLELTSRTVASPEGYRLTAGPGRETRIQAVPARQGTVAQASRLFEDYPARKQFLKRAQAESSLCRQIFQDKAAAHPGLGFRYSSDGRQAFILKASSPEERVAALYPELPYGLVHRVRFSAAASEGSVILAGPAFYRPDRRLMQVFVNRRRVTDQGLLQALDYAFTGFLPGGAHPGAFLFAEVDPAWVDFNIHPAKRELRFKDQASLRSAFVEAIKAFLLELSRREPGQTRPSVEGELGLGEKAWSPGFQSRSYPVGGSWDDLAGLRERLGGIESARPEAKAPAEAGAGTGDLDQGLNQAVYLGKVLGLFLVVESRGALYLIDQHAAHERVLFDQLMAASPAAQDLLVPAVFEPEDDAEARRLEEVAPDLAALGFGLEKEGKSWLVTALPSPLDRDPVGAVREILSSLGPAERIVDQAGEDAGRAKREQIRGARSAALATAACRAAVKDGDELDPEASLQLALKALALPEPRCPHGRPIWVRLSREELFRLVRRIV